VNVSDLRKRATVTCPEAAALIGVSKTSYYEAVRRGELPGIRIGRRIVVPSAQLLRVLGIEEPDA
jgi:excisionase family DNA binding protein